jgi:hypothetical protein
MSEAYRALAEHFGKAEHVRVIVTGNEAKTDGKTIYLPENVPAEVQDVLLATLLHEAYHIRLTDFAGKANQAQGPRRQVLNVLEDIRIDGAVFKDWPNAHNLYGRLIEYYTATHGADFDKLPATVRICRNLIIRAYERPEVFEHATHKDAEVVAWETENAGYLSRLVPAVKAAKATDDLLPLIDELLRKLFPLDEKAEEERGELVEVIRGDGKAAQDGLQKLQDWQKKAKERLEAAKDLDEEGKAAEKDAERKKGEGKVRREKAQAEEGEAEDFEGEAEDFEDEADEADKAGDKGKAKSAKEKAAEAKAKAAEKKAEAAADKKAAEDLDAEAKAKAAEAKAKAAEARKDLDALRGEKDNFAKDEAEVRKHEGKAKSAKERLDEINAEAKAAQEHGLAGLGAVQVGFDKIKGQDLKVEKLPVNVEEEVLDFLRSREERKLTADTGRIEPSKLATFFSPDAGLFVQKDENAERHTRVFFLVDQSGSMGSPLLDGKDKTRVAAEAVGAIAKAIDKGIAGGLRVEYGVFGFDTGTYTLKDFEEVIEEKELVKRLVQVRGGTSPADVVRKVENEYQPNDPKTRQVVFFITDGEFGEDDYKVIEQSTCGNLKWVYLGLNVDDADPRARQVFGRYNIVKGDDVKATIGRAIQDNLE